MQRYEFNCFSLHLPHILVITIKHSILCDMEKKQKQTPTPPKKMREHRVSFMMNDDEFNAVERYLSRYKITNKSNWYRTAILTHVLKMMEEDYPTLFKENEMRR